MMSGEGACLAAAGDAVEARKDILAQALERWRTVEHRFVCREAAFKLRVTPIWYAMAERGEIDPREIPPAVAVQIQLSTGLSAVALGIADVTNSADGLSGPGPATEERAGARMSPCSAGVLVSGDTLPGVRLGPLRKRTVEMVTDGMLVRMSIEEALQLAERLRATARAAAE